MASLDTYRQHIQQLLKAQASLVWDERIRAELIFDPESDSYLLIYAGWRGEKRLYGIVLHVDIIDGKIWVQEDGTEAGIANQLVELGVPKHDIVIGFHQPELRQYTDFALG